jgi:hypothetical protein
VTINAVLAPNKTRPTNSWASRRPIEAFDAMNAADCDTADADADTDADTSGEPGEPAPDTTTTSFSVTCQLVCAEAW